MLARTFKSAAELGMESHEYNALVTVLHMIEDGIIPPEGINMSSYHCGTKHCLAGWANVVDGAVFPETKTGSLGLSERLTPALKNLFGIDNNVASLRYANAKRATAALRTFLETGICG